MSIFHSLFSFLLASLLFAAQGSLLAEKKVCFRINNTFVGEKESTKRLQIAAENLGWKAEIRQIGDKHVRQSQYDWVMTLVPRAEPVKGNVNYQMLYDATQFYYDLQGRLRPRYHRYDAVLTTFAPSEMLKMDLREGKTQLVPFRWYPTVQSQSYRRVNPEALFFILSNWGSRKADEAQQVMRSLLNHASYTRFYGPPAAGREYEDSYFGVIPFDGQSIIDTIGEAGVCLILHDNLQIKDGIPTGRIFEAAAASAVIISDENPFVKEHFGDSVLYLAATDDGQSLFLQIDSHMRWIQENKEEALEMARRSYEIYREKFLLEDQLIALDRFHQKHFQ